MLKNPFPWRCGHRGLRGWRRLLLDTSNCKKKPIQKKVATAIEEEKRRPTRKRVQTRVYDAQKSVYLKSSDDPSSKVAVPKRRMRIVTTTTTIHSQACVYDAQKSTWLAPSGGLPSTNAVPKVPKRKKISPAKLHHRQPARSCNRPVTKDLRRR